jgi:predicted alpha/beta-fold hydrolase
MQSPALPIGLMPIPQSDPSLLPFRPAWWLPGPHLQTLWASIARRRANPAFETERLRLSDGDFVDLCWTTPKDQGPIVLILHGLEGSVRSKYAAAIASAVQRCKWTAVVFQFRGCSGEPNIKDRSYHSGDTADLAHIVATIRHRYPTRPIGAVGYSVGGNVLLKYLGERGADTALCAAAAVSVPFDLANGADRLNRGLSRFYQWHLVRSLRRKVRRKFRHRTAPIDIAKLGDWNTFWLFDEYVTAPLHGFRDAAQYYTESSSRRYLPSIERPTLIIHAEDDPFLTPAAIPTSNELSAATTLELTARGGHVGFVSGRLPLYPRYWLEGRIIAYLERFVAS